jgi:hypothetical protein
MTSGSIDSEVRRVYLDANAIEKQWPNVTGNLSMLASLGRITGVEICIPESVVIEVGLSSARRAEALLKAAKEQIFKAQETAKWFSPIPDYPDIDWSAADSQYQRVCAASAALYSINITKATSTSALDFLRLGAMHAPAFKNEDQGFRDTVHLHSVIEHLRAHPLQSGHAVFVTSDDSLSKADLSHATLQPRVNLQFQKPAKVIAAVRGQLSPSQAEHFETLAGQWEHQLLVEARTGILPQLAENVLGFPLTEGLFVAATFDEELDGEATTTSVVSIPDSSNFRASFKLRFRFDGVGERVTLIERGTRTHHLDVGWVDLLLDVGAKVRTDNGVNLTDVEFEYARVVAGSWGQPTDRRSEQYDFINLL